MRPGILKILWFVFVTSLRLNLIKTLYFNFKVLPLRQAVKLPVHFYGKVDFANLSGRFTIDSSIHFGMVVFGGQHEVVITSNLPTRIYNSGTITFENRAVFARGINIMVWDNGNLHFGNNLQMGSLCRIIVFKNMRFKPDVLVSWECQFFDTDFHFIETADKQIEDNCAAVLIGESTWIGARATILKGTTIVKDSIIAANALCSGNYEKKYNGSVLLAGVPAKAIKHDVRYVKDKNREIELFKHFANDQNTTVTCNR